MQVEEFGTHHAAAKRSAMTTKMTIITRTTILCGIGGIAAATALAAVTLAVTPRPAQAQPAYAQKTGLHCAMCHNNAKGGGPLTAFGAKWIASGMKARPPKAGKTK
jgi:mono/diheme cytochrome c family protein